MADSLFPHLPGPRCHPDRRHAERSVACRSGDLFKHHREAIQIRLTPGFAWGHKNNIAEGDTNPIINITPPPHAVFPTFYSLLFSSLPNKIKPKSLNWPQNTYKIVYRKKRTFSTAPQVPLIHPLWLKGIACLHPKDFCMRLLFSRFTCPFRVGLELMPFKFQFQSFQGICCLSEAIFNFVFIHPVI